MDRQSLARVVPSTAAGAILNLDGIHLQLHG